MLQQIDVPSFLEYLDLQLSALADKHDKELPPDKSGMLYEDIYAILNDIEATLEIPNGKQPAKTQLSVSYDRSHYAQADTCKIARDASLSHDIALALIDQANQHGVELDRGYVRRQVTLQLRKQDSMLGEITLMVEKK